MILSSSRKMSRRYYGPINAEQRERLEAALRQGVGAAKAADVVGCSYATAWRLRQQLIKAGVALASARSFYTTMLAVNKARFNRISASCRRAAATPLPADTSAEVKAFIKRRGVTKCPPAYVGVVNGAKPLKVKSYDNWVGWREGVKAAMTAGVAEAVAKKRGLK